MSAEHNKIFRFIFEKKGKNPEFTTPVPVKNESGVGPANDKIKKVVKGYLEQALGRDTQNTNKRIGNVYKGEDLNRRVLNLPEARLHNSLLRIMVQHRIPINNIAFIIKQTLAEELHGESQEIQASINSILRGVESSKEAFLSFEKTLEKEYSGKETWVATNDHLDAMYKVDLIGAVEKEGQVNILYLVQVKSSSDNAVVAETVKAHQEYLNLLPQLIGPLNKKEAPVIVERELTMSEILDKNRQETDEELALFSLVLEQYVHDTENTEKISASVFYEKYKKEGGILNPFTVMGILKKKENLNKYFKGEEEVGKRLALTADDIHFSEEESIAFYKKNYVNTILDTAEVYSVVMQKGKEVYRKKLDIQKY